MTEAAAHALVRLFVDELSLAGVRHACLSPGSRSTPLVLALDDHPSISTHVVLDERSAAFMALGVARASAAPAVVASTSGTAAANFHPAVIEAHQSRTPLLVLTADRPPELRGTGANQTIDQIKLYGDAVRLFCEVGVPDEHPMSHRYWRSLAAHAVAAATGSPPGPVHLNLAFREPLVPDAVVSPTERRRERPWTTFRPGARLPSPADVEWLAGLVAERPRGLVVAGALSLDPEPVLGFAETAGYPVLAEPASNLRSGTCAVPAYDALVRVQGFTRSHVPELVIRLGKTGLSKPVSALLGRDVEQVVIDPDGAWLDPDRSATTIVACDPAALLGEVAKAVEARADAEWLRAWRDAGDAARSAMDELLDRHDEPTEPRTARDLAACLPAGAHLFVASSMPVRDLDSFMAPRDGLHVHANRGANGIDGTVSTALGISLAASGPVAALLGDLAMLHDQNGLLATRGEPIDCTFVVVNNDGGGIFSFLPQARADLAFERLFGTPHGMDFGTLAHLYGCAYARVERASEFRGLVGDALAAGGIRIIEVRTRREANVELHRRLWGAADHAVRSVLRA